MPKDVKRGELWKLDWNALDSAYAANGQPRYPPLKGTDTRVDPRADRRHPFLIVMSLEILLVPRELVVGVLVTTLKRADEYNEWKDRAERVFIPANAIKSDREDSPRGVDCGQVFSLGEASLETRIGRVTDDRILDEISRKIAAIVGYVPQVP